MPPRLRPRRRLGRLLTRRRPTPPGRRQPHLRGQSDRSRPATPTRPRPPAASRSTPAPPTPRSTPGPPGRPPTRAPASASPADEPGSSFECRLDSASRRRLGRLLARRRPTPTSPTAPTPSRSEPPTRPATPTRPRRRRSFTVDTSAPDTQIDSGPTGTTTNAQPQLHLLGRSSPARPSSAASTPPTPPTGPPAARRRPTPTSPTATTPSRSGPPTRPATPTRPRPAAASPSTPAPPRPRSTPGPPGRPPTRAPASASRPIEPGAPSSAASTPLRRRLGRLLLAEGLHHPRRRQPHLRGPSDRPGRQHRPDPGLAAASRRHRRPRHPDRLRAHRDDHQLAAPASASRPMSPALPSSAASTPPSAADWAACSPAEGLHQPRRRQPHLRGQGDRPGRQHRPDPGLAAASRSTPAPPTPRSTPGPPGRPPTPAPASASRPMSPALPSVPPRLRLRRRLGRLLAPEGLHQPGRRQPHLRGQSDRSGRQHRPDPGLPQLHDRHRRPRHPDRLRAHRDDLQLEPQLRLLGR